MSTKVTPEDMTKVLNDILQDYAREVKDTYGNVGKEVAELGVQALQQDSPKHTGEYARSWTYKEEKGFMGYPIYIIYNAEHYRLTHLLEYGHVIRNGTKRDLGNVKPNKHIKDVEEKVKDILPLFFEQELNKI